MTERSFFLIVIHLLLSIFTLPRLLFKRMKCYNWVPYKNVQVLTILPPYSFLGPVFFYQISLTHNTIFTLHTWWKTLLCLFFIPLVFPIVLWTWDESVSRSLSLWPWTSLTYLFGGLSSTLETNYLVPTSIGFYWDIPLYCPPLLT